MSKFHSTVSRRDFMKGLGLAGAGLGAAAAIAPVFHDVDEVTSAANSGPKHPWWVKKLDYDKSTTEIDWNLFSRYDKRNHSMNAPSRDGTVITQEQFDQGNEIGNQRLKQWILDKKPAFSLRDYSLLWGVRQNRQSSKFLPPKAIRSPQELGVPAWQGTPEENSQTVRAAARQYGAAEVGFVELNEQNKKFLWLHSGKKFVEFESVDEPYETGEKSVIPNKCEWAIVMLTEMSQKTYEVGAPGHLGRATVMDAYGRISRMNLCMQDFLHGMGYIGISGSPGAILGLGVMSGLVELGRFQITLSPSYGAMIRKTDIIITDLPLAPTNPIDAGMNRFCYSCKKCGEACPSGAIDLETEPSWDVEGPWNNTGYRCWHLNRAKCYSQWGPYATDCGTCQAVCTFHKAHSASIHEAVSATVATTGIFNGFFRQMDDVFGYGKAFYPDMGEFNSAAEKWWEQDLPPYGIYSQPSY